MKSRPFRDEFFSLVRNDEIHIKLFSLHLFLITDRLRHMNINFGIFSKRWREYIDLKYTYFVLNNRKFPKSY